MPIDFEAEGLLDDLEGADREARRKLLEHLNQEGFSLEELVTAVAEDRLALLAVERVLGGKLTAAEVQERTGLPADLLGRLRRMLGLSDPGPDVRVYGEEDIAMAQSTRLFIEAGLSERAIGEMTRVLGESMARLAATTASAFVETFLRPGDTEYDVAVRFASLAQREAGALAEAQELSVCFADLVGFTRMGVQVQAQELGGLAGRFAELANEVTSDPVRLIKTIGDAAMFVSPDAAAMVEVALSFVEAMRTAEMPSVRAGIASGPTLLRAGDYYGHSVNLASRVTGVARPGSVLCAQEVRDAAADAFEWSFAGKHRLKGVGDAVPLHRARRPKADRPSG
jgi:adenylate cyclase